MDLQSEKEFYCPFCASRNTLFLDLTAGRRQEFTVDCEVCCHPIKISVSLGRHRSIELRVEPENG